MATQYRPEIGAWYELASGELFEIVAHDLEDGTIDIQYFDGAIEELDMETWNALALMTAEPPEDFSGSMDMMHEDIHTGDRPSGVDYQTQLDGMDFDH